VLRHVHGAIFSVIPEPATLTGNCGNKPGIACRLVWDITHNGQAAQVTNNFLAGPVVLLLRLIFVVVLALLVRAVVYRVINRLTERAAESLLPTFRNGSSAAQLTTRRLRRRRSRRRAGTEAAGVERALVDERRRQRVGALGSILRSAASVTIFAIAGVVILGDLGINLAPLLASASVVGVAVGFGAQNLVRDYLSGVFMLLEDQYGVGDVISVGGATGIVETVTLRITRLRDVKGIVWHVRNGAIDQVGNESQGWARAVIDFPVPYTADLAMIKTILQEVADTIWAEPTWHAVMLERPEVWGAQEVTGSVVTMRMVVRTSPLRQWEVEREMRARVKAALDAAGIPPSGA
jgi:small conductance mechanosensitive channel